MERRILLKSEEGLRPISLKQKKKKKKKKTKKKKKSMRGENLKCIQNHGRKTSRDLRPDESILLNCLRDKVMNTYNCVQLAQYTIDPT
jgi:hypothetical protein